VWGREGAGGREGRLLEIDVLREEGHDLLCDQGIYSGLLRCAVEGKLDALRSVLRHYDIPGQPDCPRPIRAWGGEEFGIKDATEEEKKKLQEDDLVAWRMVFLFMVASFVRKARGIPEKVQFTLEQPSSPKAYKPEVVSWWDTWHWQELKKEFDFKETQVKHRGLGGTAEKPTTFGGNLALRPEEHYVSRGGAEEKSEEKKIRSSKALSRWPPGIMAMVACALQRSVMQKTPALKAISWEQHLAMNHTPYRRDCLVCQQTLQQAHPHRRVKHPTGGVLSLDTAGPLVKAQDVTGGSARYFLVGAVTWAVPLGIVDLKDAAMEEEVPEEEIEEAPQIEEEEEDQIDQREAKKNKKEAQSCKEPVEERQEPEPVPDPAQEEKGVDFVVKTFRLAYPMTSKRSTEVSKIALEMLLRLRADGYHIIEFTLIKGTNLLANF
jgi:hypothetical protein